jgi:hypothetical protein
MARKLAAVDPGNASWRGDLVVALYKVSTASDVAFYPTIQAASGCAEIPVIATGSTGAIGRRPQLHRLTS